MAARSARVLDIDKKSFVEAQTLPVYREMKSPHIERAEGNVVHFYANLSGLEMRRFIVEEVFDAATIEDTTHSSEKSCKECAILPLINTSRNLLSDEERSLENEELRVTLSPGGFLR